MSELRMPALFVGHGNPMNAITDGEDQRVWRQLAARLPRPRAVLAISAHWQTRGVRVTASARPETIHDFSGFPRELSELTYPAPGDPVLAGRVLEAVATVPVQLDEDRGLDHGVWSVLSVMLPAADIPVVQLSLDATKPGSFHYGVGKQLAALRDEGVLILASGNIVHNWRLSARRAAGRLGDPFRRRGPAAVARTGARHAHRLRAAWRRRGAQRPHARHYLPLIYLIATQRPREAVEFFNARIENGIAMTSFLIGAPRE